METGKSFLITTVINSSSAWNRFLWLSSFVSPVVATKLSKVIWKKMRSESKHVIQNINKIQIKAAKRRIETNNKRKQQNAIM